MLDHRLKDEARAATLQTRRLLLGAADVDGGEAVLGDTEEDTETLPSYPSHVRDRVANAYLPDSATMRVANAWVVNGISPTIPERSAATPGVHSESSSGMQSPAVLETWPVVAPGGMRRPPRSEHLPNEPQPGAHPLEWVNTELLLSLGSEAPEAPVQRMALATPPSRTPPPEAVSRAQSRPLSRFPSRRGSRANSRANSRAASPERSSSDIASSDGRSTGAAEHANGSANGVANGSGGAYGLPRGRSEETFVHSHSTASRNMHGLFNIAMKPFTSLSSTFNLGGSRAGSHANLAALAANGGGSGSGAGSPAASGSGTATPAHPQEPMTSQEMLHHAFTQVPDYDMASRGFLGGGITPLSTLRDLPTYESVQEEMRRQGAGAGGGAGAIGAGDRSFSDGDLAGMFAAHGAPAGVHAHAHGRGLPGRSGLSRLQPLRANTTVVTP